MSRAWAARERRRLEVLEKRHLMAVVAPNYEVTNQWGNEFEARITLENTDVIKLSDWAVSFDYQADISEVWGATLVSRDGNRYSVANEGWNADIESGKAIAFYLIGTTDVPATEIDAPVTYAVNETEVSGVTGGPRSEAGAGDAHDQVGDPLLTTDSHPYEAVFRALRSWDEGFIGEFTVKNNSVSHLAGWELAFEYTGSIDSVWNGLLAAHSGTRYTIKSPPWNHDLAPGGAATIRFRGTLGQVGEVPQGLTVSGICDGPMPLLVEVPVSLPVLRRPSPLPTPDPIDGEGDVYAVGPSRPDVQGFDSTADRFDFGSHTARSITFGKNGAGDLAFFNPWAAVPAFQAVPDVTYAQLSIENFVAIADEHLRQDLGGVLSWEHQVGPREPSTIYIRSHETGVQDRVEGFDPQTMKISLLYLGTRDRLFVEDTPEGLLISVGTTGQSTLLVGVSKASLVGGNIEFHHDQVVESRLFVPFGFEADDVAIVSRSGLLTPAAPSGTSTDGHQTRAGNSSPRPRFFSEFAATTEVSVLVDLEGLAYLREAGGEPIPITRVDGYWQGSVPLSRNGATITAAARDELGRLRVLDAIGGDGYAWILDENGYYVGEEGPNDTSLQIKESLFQIDIDGDGVIETVAGVNSGNAGDELWGEAFFAPYVDMGFWEVPNLAEIAHSRGTSLLTLAFLLSTAEGKTSWAGWDSLALDSESERAVAINDSIAEFQRAGGDVMVSFGGAAGNSLAHVHAAQGKTALELAQAYIDVVNKYSLNRIDFDIEGTAITDPVSIALRSEALALFQQLRPDVEVWYTLPAVPSGLTYNGHVVIRSAMQAGVVLDGVNIMAMNFGEWAAPTTGPDAQTMGFYAIASATGAHDQLVALYAEFGHEFSWSQLGVTPMIGVNDITTQVFGVEDAKMLKEFARLNGLGMLSMWSVARDNPGGLGQATATTSGLDLPAGSFSTVFSDYGTQNVEFLYEEVFSANGISVLTNYLGMAYISEQGSQPIAVTRSDGYWQGNVPLSRDGATIIAAARDHLGRLRILDGNGVDVYAWILDDNGHYLGEEGPGDTSLASKETLFQIDLDADGLIGEG